MLFVLRSKTGVSKWIANQNATFKVLRRLTNQVYNTKKVCEKITRLTVQSGTPEGPVLFGFLFDSLATRQKPPRCAGFPRKVTATG